MPPRLFVRIPYRMAIAMNTLYLSGPVGELTLAQEGAALTHLLFGHVDFPGAQAQETSLLAEARRQLAAYFAGELRAFTLPLAPRGTPFQQKVWQALLTIPYGETRSYQQIAEMAGSPRAFRAAGMANHNNPISILIPCHRVVGKNGSLTGYGGGLEAKRFLLELEGAALRQGRGALPHTPQGTTGPLTPPSP